MGGRVEGKVVLITGAAGGQGRSHALHFAAEGADIIAMDLPGREPDAGGLRRLQDEIEALGRRLSIAEADVRDFAAVDAAVARGVEALGHLDIIVANAGIYRPGGPVETIDPMLWPNTLEVNVTGGWHTCKASIPHLPHGPPGGSIVIISSGAGLTGIANAGHYVASKHAVVGLMRTMAVELGPYMIRVNSIHSTNVDTPMIHNEHAYAAAGIAPGPHAREEFSNISREMNLLPIPWIEPSDVSSAVLFLASDEARYITGVTLPVDAGFLLK